MGVSMKSDGWALPAQHQTISGGKLLFHVVAVAITSEQASEEVTSALMWLKRCVVGERAFFYHYLGC